MGPAGCRGESSFAPGPSPLHPQPVVLARSAGPVGPVGVGPVGHPVAIEVLVRAWAVFERRLDDTAVFPAEQTPVAGIRVLQEPEALPADVHRLAGLVAVRDAVAVAVSAV